MFSKLLIANRGEIACRIAATAAKLKIRTVAVYSDADRKSKHVVACDEAIHVGGSAAGESYLRVDALIDAARKSKAPAIHPGYGFLAESVELAEACANAGIVFVGPPASAIRAMGDKGAAKALMEKAGLPLVPGYHGEKQEADFLKTMADEIGYPIILKAAAGGGGKAMRVVDDPSRFETLLEACRREAKNSFGNDRVLVEKYLSRPRHIEIQIFADSWGNCIYLFERDCSIQRRHQKVIEEAPAPDLPTEQRRSMGEAAVAAARAVNYAGAGTVEFMVNQEGDFYFMEMNTRLQVEHPVTEMITKQDLVEWQLRIAAGDRLPLLQHELARAGHSIEARIYAENPEKNFLPSTGKLTVLRTPPAAEFEVGEKSVRIDSGVREGDTITPFYDPMIAKLIVWGDDRASAIKRLREALSRFHVLGPQTNIAFLQRLLSVPSFLEADLDTGLIERHHVELFPSPVSVSFSTIALATAALLNKEREAGDSSPWASYSGWRLNGPGDRTLRWLVDGREVEVLLIWASSAMALKIEGQILIVTPLQSDDDELILIERNVSSAEVFESKSLSDFKETSSVQIDERKIRGSVYTLDSWYHVFEDDRHTILKWIDPLSGSHEAHHGAGELTAPMPGKIVAIFTKKGDRVKQGEPLMAMEAMKMEYTIMAPVDGAVSEVFFGVGDQVAEGAELLRMEEHGPG